MNLIKTLFETPYGWMGLERNRSGLTHSTIPYPDKRDCEKEISKWPSTSKAPEDIFSEYKKLLNQYFSGNHIDLSDIPLDYSGSTLFFQDAWRACLLIPFGETRSYKWIAGKALRPNAYRAAGRAMSNNKLPIVVPCHRVIGSNGKLTGYKGTNRKLDLKAQLLQLESDTVAKNTNA